MTLETRAVGSVGVMF